MLVNDCRSWRTWNEQGKQQKQSDRGKLMRWAVDMAKAEWQAGKHNPQNKALQANTAGRLSVRHRPQNQQPAVGRLRSKNTTAARRCCLAFRRAGKWMGGSAVVLAARKAGADLPNCPYPTYRLCLSLSLPTPLICHTQFSPKLTSLFCYFYFFYPFTSPLEIVP